MSNLRNKLSKQDLMYQNIQRHGEHLVKLFGLDMDPIALCKKLRRLEVQANRLMVDYCNGVIDDRAVETSVDLLISPALAKIIGEENMGQVYINQDPRGYTLKLTEEASREAIKSIPGLHKDWGAYVILAPDFRED